MKHGRAFNGMLMSAALAVLPVIAAAAPKIGDAAPAFVGSDANGRAVKLSELAGRTVVLEWTNDGCPYVVKWYKSGEMQKLQRDATSRGAVWLTVASSAVGEQGYVDGPAANRQTQERAAAPTHFLLDPKGEIGRAYGAQVTPHMYVVAPDGRLAYMGGIDSIASTDPADIPRAEPLARRAIDEVLNGKPVTKPVSRAYGCSVKYGN